MANVRTQVSNLIGGISQQEPAKRVPGQVTDANNMVGNPVDGLRVRPGTHYVNDIFPTLNPQDIFLHTIERGDGENYIVAIDNDQVQVSDLEGNSIHVEAPLGYGYLNGRTPNSLAGAENLVTGPNWSHFSLLLTPTTITGPLGFGTWWKYAPAAELVDMTLYSDSFPLPGGNRQVSLYVLVPPVSGPDDSLETIRISIIDNVGNYIYVRCDWNIVAGAVVAAGTFTLPNGDPLGAHTKFTTFVKSTDEGDVYRIGFSIDAVVPAGAAVHFWSAGSYLDHYVHVFGPHWSNAQHKAYTYGPVAGNIRATTVKDFTFISNRHAIPAMGTNVTDDGLAGATDKAFLFGKQAFDRTTYNTFIRTDNEAAEVQCSARIDTSVSNVQGTQGSLDMSSLIAVLVNGVSGGVFAGTRLGLNTRIAVHRPDRSTVLRILPAAAATHFDSLRAEAGSYGKALSFIWKEVQDFTDLPAYCEPGFVVAVSSDSSVSESRYYVKHVANEGLDLVTTTLFKEGYWQETTAPEILDEFDEDTMPHVLIRVFDDAAGTVTGTPFAIYFLFEPAAWESRLAGDDDTNKAPSFIGQPINDVFLFKGRLGILSGENVNLSENDAPFNFWRTTVRSVLATDPIDLSAAIKDVAVLHWAVAGSNVLILGSENQQFLLTGGPEGLSPASAQIAPILRHQMSVDVPPRLIGSEVVFISPRDDNSLVRNIQILDGGSARTSDFTQQIPRLLPETITTFTASTTSGSAFVSDGRLGYVWKWFDAGGERIQSAWFKYTFRGDIVAASFIKDTLYLLINQSDGLQIESLLFSSGQDLAFHVDREVELVSATFTGSVTTFTLPYAFSAAERDHVRAFDSNGDPVDLIIPAGGGSLVAILGDVTGATYRFGLVFDASVSLTRPFITTGNQSAPVLIAPQSVLWLALGLNRTDSLTVTSSARNVAASTETIDTGGETERAVEVLIGLAPEDLEVVLANNDAAPFGITNLEWAMVASIRDRFA